jgi:hypothetical protein
VVRDHAVVAASVAGSAVVVKRLQQTGRPTQTWASNVSLIKLEATVAQYVVDNYAVAAASAAGSIPGCKGNTVNTDMDITQQ